MFKIVTLICVTLLPSLAHAEMTADSFVYTCDNGAVVPATYINSAEGSFVVLTQDGAHVALQTQVSASGAKYAPAEGQPGVIWWTKGVEATLYSQGKTPAEDVLIATCVEKQ